MIMNSVLMNLRGVLIRKKTYSSATVKGFQGSTTNSIGRSAKFIDAHLANAMTIFLAFQWPTKMF